MINMAMATGILQKYDFPTYYVTASLMEALRIRILRAGISWDDLVFPYDGVVFMVPHNTLADEDGDEVFALGVCRVQPGGAVALPGVRTKISGLPERRIEVFWIMKPYGMEIQDVSFPAADKLEPDAAWIDLKTSEFKQQKGMPENARYGVSGVFASHMAGMAANLLLVLQARPELVEQGVHTGRRLRTGVPIHRPTMLGRKYLIQRKYDGPVESTGHFTELGWRAGHMRRQHYGPREASTVKVIFIDPYMAFTRGIQRDT